MIEIVCAKLRDQFGRCVLVDKYVLTSTTTGADENAISDRMSERNVLSVRPEVPWSK
jgi:hypothetical protein